MNRSRAFASGFVVLYVCAIGRAQAYIDPGTGSMLLQMLGACIAGAIFYFRELRYKILSLFSRRPDPAAHGSGKAPDETPR